MKVYVGQTRGSELIAELEGYGWGEAVQPYELPNRRSPWFFDNGAYVAFRHAEPWDVSRYQRALDFIHLHSQTRPDFAVVPDVVAGGLESLRFSLTWLPRLRQLRCPLYLAVQDGMTGADLQAGGWLERCGGLFVGGTPQWKHDTAAAWVKLAHAHQLPCHVGKVGSMKLAAWARRIGVDSIDSCAPLFATRNRRRFLRGLAIRDLFPEGKSLAVVA